MTTNRQNTTAAPRKAHREFYQGITIEIRKEGKGWRVLVDGERDAWFDTKANAVRYVNLTIKAT